MGKIVVSLICLIDFIKAPTYSNQRDIWLIVEPNDGTMKAPNIEYFERGNESVPFIFMDLRNPKTGRLSLAATKVGPKASFSKERVFLEDLLDELGYGCCNYKDRPRIIQSSLAIS